MFCRKVSISRAFWQKSLETNACFVSFVLLKLFSQCFSEVVACFWAEVFGNFCSAEQLEVLSFGSNSG